MSVWAELPDSREFPNDEDDAADSLKCWVSRNWFGVVGSGDFAHYLAGTRVERLRTIKSAFAYAGKRYLAKKEEMPAMEQKPGRYWGVIGRQHLPLELRAKSISDFSRKGCQKYPGQKHHTPHPPFGTKRATFIFLPTFF